MQLHASQTKCVKRIRKKKNPSSETGDMNQCSTLPSGLVLRFGHLASSDSIMDLPHGNVTMFMYDVIKAASKAPSPESASKGLKVHSLYGVEPP